MSYSEGGSQPGTIRRSVGSPAYNDWTNGPPGVRTSSVVIYGGAKATDSEIYRVGVYGWRKRCLYCLILLLTIMIVINLALTVWIMSVLNFHTGGIGGMTILQNGIRVNGRTEFQKDVNFQSLRAPENDALFIDSAKRVVLQSRSIRSAGNVSSRFILGGGEARAECDRFEIVNAQGNPLFYADRNEVAVKVENLRIISDGGSVFDGSVQTPVVRSEPNANLVLESPTNNLRAMAAKNIDVEAQAGDVRLEALHNIDIESKRGQIRLDSSNIFMTRLMQASSGGSQVRDQYQLCLCQNGRLFVSDANVDCRASNEIC